MAPMVYNAYITATFDQSCTTTRKAAVGVYSPDFDRRCWGEYVPLEVMGENWPLHQMQPRAELYAAYSVIKQAQDDEDVRIHMWDGLGYQTCTYIRQVAIAHPPDDPRERYNDDLAEGIFLELNIRHHRLKQSIEFCVEAEDQRLRCRHHISAHLLVEKTLNETIPPWQPSHPRYGTTFSTWGPCQTQPMLPPPSSVPMPPGLYGITSAYGTTSSTSGPIQTQPMLPPHLNVPVPPRKYNGTILYGNTASTSGPLASQFMLHPPPDEAPASSQLHDTTTSSTFGPSQAQPLFPPQFSRPVPPQMYDTTSSTSEASQIQPMFPADPSAPAPP